MELNDRGILMLLSLENEGIYSVSLEVSYMLAASFRSITASIKGSEVCIYREEFRSSSGATSTLIDKYSTANRISALLKAFSEYDFPVAEDGISRGEKDDYYTLVGPIDIADNSSWTLDFKSQQRSIYIKGWLQHECYSEVLAILTEYFPQFSQINEVKE